MGIDVRWEDENGNELDVVLSPRESKFAAIIPPTASSEFSCLRHIDPYGDTVFNQIQVPLLADELKRTLSLSLDDETRQHVEAILALVRKANEVHTYIKFYGD